MRHCWTTVASWRIFASKSGVDVMLEIVPEMQHVFQFLAGTAPQGDAAIRRLADWVRPKLGLV
jgi:epsilon-lactone hydrolase